MMEDKRFREFKYCEFLGVYKSLPSIFGKYLIRIRVGESACNIFGDVHEIYIQNSNLKDNLSSLLNGGNKLYLSYGMADVDIDRDKDSKGFIIMNSPSDSIYLTYHLSESDFKKLVESIE